MSTTIKHLDITFYFDEHKKLSQAAFDFDGVRHNTADMRSSYNQYGITHPKFKWKDACLVISRSTIDVPKDNVRSMEAGAIELSEPPMQLWHRVVMKNVECHIAHDMGDYQYIYPDDQQLAEALKDYNY